MALEAVVFSQDPLTNYTCCSKEYNLFSSGGFISNSNNFGMNNYDQFANYSSKLLLEEDNNQANYCTNNNVGIFDNYDSEILIDDVNHQWDHHQQQPPQQQHQPYSVMYDYSSPEEYLSGEPPPAVVMTTTVDGGGSRRKRRRRSCKNKEEVEQQRMTHIAVERNRRKQMNDYLAVIRSLMPPSYVQRGDQASIVGGAINYVKELEQMLQSMESQRRNEVHHRDNHHHHHQNEEEQNQIPESPKGGDLDKKVDETETPVFADFFSFPQYSTRSSEAGGSNSVSRNTAAGEIEVTMVESHANVKMLAKKQPKQLLKLIAGFQGLRLNVLHLNVTTFGSFVLYSLSLKVEEGCQMNSVDDIAAAANHILAQIQEEAAAVLL